MCWQKVIISYYAQEFEWDLTSHLKLSNHSCSRNCWNSTDSTYTKTYDFFPWASPFLNLCELLVFTKSSEFQVQNHILSSTTSFHIINCILFSSFLVLHWLHELLASIDSKQSSTFLFVFPCKQYIIQCINAAEVHCGTWQCKCINYKTSYFSLRHWANTCSSAVVSL